MQQPLAHLIGRPSAKTARSQSPIPVNNSINNPNVFPGKGGRPIRDGRGTRFRLLR